MIRLWSFYRDEPALNGNGVIVNFDVINCEINLMLTWLLNCVISANAAADQEKSFAITETKLYVSCGTCQLKAMQNSFKN